MAVFKIENHCIAVFEVQNHYICIFNRKKWSFNYFLIIKIEITDVF